MSCRAKRSTLRDSGGPRETADQELSARSILLGTELRRIVLARAPAGSLTSLPPDLALGVTPHGRLCGVVIVDRQRQGPARGGLTISSGISLTNALILAGSTTLQLALASIDRGSHHCVLWTPVDATPEQRADALREYLATLERLLDAGICEITYTHDDRTMRPQIASQGLVASAAATTLAALEHLGIDAGKATVAVHRSGGRTLEIAEWLRGQGLSIVADDREIRRKKVDVMLIDSSPWRLDLDEAARINVRLIVSIGVVLVSSAVERRLRKAGTVLLPETLAAAGPFITSDLIDRGLGDQVAIERTFETCRLRTLELLDRADSLGAPPTETIRAEARAVLRG